MKYIKKDKTPLNPHEVFISVELSLAEVMVINEIFAKSYTDIVIDSLRKSSNKNIKELAETISGSGYSKTDVPLDLYNGTCNILEDNNLA
jgi:hypothetical protein